MALDHAGNVQREQKAAAQRRESDRLWALGQQLERGPFIESGVVRELTPFDEPIRIVNLQSMSICLGNCGQREQSEMRMYIEEFQRTFLGHDQVIDQQHFHEPCSVAVSNSRIPTAANSFTAFSIPLAACFLPPIIRLRSASECFPSANESR